LSACRRDHCDGQLVQAVGFLFASVLVGMLIAAVLGVVVAIGNSFVADVAGIDLLDSRGPSSPLQIVVRAAQPWVPLGIAIHAMMYCELSWAGLSALPRRLYASESTHPLNSAFQCLARVVPLATAAAEAEFYARWDGAWELRVQLESGDQAFLYARPELDHGVTSRVTLSAKLEHAEGDDEDLPLALLAWGAELTPEPTAHHGRRVSSMIVERGPGESDLDAQLGNVVGLLLRCVAARSAEGGAPYREPADITREPLPNAIELVSSTLAATSNPEPFEWSSLRWFATGLLRSAVAVACLAIVWRLLPMATTWRVATMAAMAFSLLVGLRESDAVLWPSRPRRSPRQVVEPAQTHLTLLFD
jgi:hypothetical protein